MYVTVKGYVKNPEEFVVHRERHENSTRQNDSSPWKEHSFIYDEKVEISSRLDAGAREVMQRENAQYSGLHETNQVMSVFNKYLLSLDWDEDLQKLYSFDTWVDRNFHVNIFSVLPNN